MTVIEPTDAQRRESAGERKIILKPQVRTRRRKPDQHRDFDQAFVLWVSRPYQGGPIWPEKQGPVVMLTFVGLHHQVEVELPIDIIEGLRQLVT